LEKDARATAESFGAMGFAVREEGAEWVATDPWGTPVRLVT
jgi:hypothetical protein